LYGLFKNLKFFEPFLLIFFLQSGLNLFHIGLLYSIREGIKYLLEIPSGVIADVYGKKTELLLSFIFYIISFLAFYLGTVFIHFIAAIILFGLGEAFRSGTHKAMILLYLEQKDWFKHKNFVYSRTRSFSLLGSSLSAFLAIYLVLTNDSLQTLFLICIIPYFIDFFLILSYPGSLNDATDSRLSIKVMYTETSERLKSIGRSRNMLRTMTSSSLFDAVFKSVKDYIQPILQTAVLGAATLSIFNLDQDETIKVSLAIIYGVMYLISSFSTRYVYKLNIYRNSAVIMNFMFDLMGIVSIMIAAFIYTNWLFAIILMFFLLFIMQNGRRPLFVDVIAILMNKTERATVLSAESQLKSLFIVILAPLFGLIADTFSIPVLFIVIGIAAIVINRFIRVPTVQKEN